MIDEPYDQETEAWLNAYYRNIEKMVHEQAVKNAHEHKLVFKIRQVMPPEPALDLLEKIYHEIPTDFLEDYLRVTVKEIPHE